MIVSQYELILEVKELKEAGFGKDEIVKTLGVHEFRVKKAIGFADKYSSAALRSILISAYDTDKNIKSGLITQDLAPVSYTHLDVYKGQVYYRCRQCRLC